MGFSFWKKEKKGDGKESEAKCVLLFPFVSCDVAMLLRNTNEGILAAKRAEFSAKLLWNLKEGFGR